MTDELFAPESVASESPRLRWMKEHGITVMEHDWTGTDFEGTAEPRWQAFTDIPYWRDQLGKLRNDGPRDDTEEGALVELAKQKGIRTWNEPNTP